MRCRRSVSAECGVAGSTSSRMHLPPYAPASAKIATEETMVFAFDTLSSARHLRDHDVPQDQVEAYAEAARQFIMAELVTSKT